MQNLSFIASDEVFGVQHLLFETIMTRDPETWIYNRTCDILTQHIEEVAKCNLGT